MSNERIDVLAVMERDALDAAIRRQWDDVSYAQQCSEESDKARAAVAELIEAAAHMSEWWSIDSSLPQVVALRAAISRIGAAP